jgi:hypothetical protein
MQRDIAQILNYLKAIGIKLGVLENLTEKEIQ